MTTRKTTTRLKDRNDFSALNTALEAPLFHGRAGYWRDPCFKATFASNT